MRPLARVALATAALLAGAPLGLGGEPRLCFGVTARPLVGGEARRLGRRLGVDALVLEDLELGKREEHRIV